MKKIFFLLSLALTLVYCNTPQPATSPDTRDTTSTMNTRTDTTGRDTTNRDTTRQQPLF